MVRPSVEVASGVQKRVRHMRLTLLVLALLCVPVQSAFATFSIIAIDPATGDLGVAVASKFFGLGGSGLSLAEANVGVVATHGNVGYGPRALELLRQGLSAQQVVDRLFADDPVNRRKNQIAIIDAKGNVAVFSDAMSDWKGHRQGATFSAQGNTLAGPAVVEAMARAFEAARGELAERLFAALKAGDDAGGDRRGKQSASMYVVRKGGGRGTNSDRYVVISVDDHPQPMTELRRLLDMQLSMNYSSRISSLFLEGKTQEALAAARTAARYAPTDATAQMQLGFLLYLTGDSDQALQSFRAARALNPDFRQAWDTMAATAAYKKILDDREFVARIPR